ncbi:hypothetical protein CDL12_24163 [Handroanthus impetiginosus]|uniref:Ty3 transposon capsid-like protein domain-containing protein n=1 Tax=Handroanthus impetiginosus TaxID=429701 RepID=A0A2G9GDE4_9LAMI|nr:hypothetical protein CDL12_24163 [Handroanthus impetiginosus]
MEIVSSTFEKDGGFEKDGVSEKLRLLMTKLEEHDVLLGQVKVLMEKSEESGRKLPEEMERAAEQFEVHGEKVAGSPHKDVRIPILDFPRFDGENPKTWIWRCHNFFLKKPVDDHKKVHMASRHMDGEAKMWYMSSIAGNKSIGWTTFIKLLMERFDVSQSANFEWHIINLRQEGSVVEYIRQFEEFKVLMIASHTEEFFVNAFVNGLREEIRHMVEMLAPSTLMEAICIARKQEDLLNAMTKTGLGQQSVTNNIFGKWIGRRWLACLLPFFLLAASKLFAGRFHLITAKLCRLFGWQDRVADRAPSMGPSGFIDLVTGGKDIVDQHLSPPKSVDLGHLMQD